MTEEILIGIRDFLQPYLPLLNSHNVDYLTCDHWNTYVPEWIRREERINLYDLFEQRYRECLPTMNLLDEFIDESNFADNSFSNDDDDNVYREKQNRLNEAWQSIRIQLRDALIELESQHNVEENVCPNGKCVNDELYKSITVDCIYFERKY